MWNIDKKLVFTIKQRCK